MPRITLAAPSVLIALLASLSPASALALPPTAEAFFAEPQFDAVTISPDGRHLAALVNGGGERRLVVMAREKGRARFLEVPDSVREHHWATDERLLLTIGAPGQSPGLAAVNRDGRGYARLIPPGADSVTGQGVRIVSLLPRERAHVLVSVDERAPHAPDVYRVDLFSGERRTIANNPGRFFRWLADGRGRVRAALGWEPRSDGIRYGLWYRFVPDGRWKRLREFVPGGRAVTPLAFEPDGGLLVAASVERNTASVRSLDPVTGSLGPALFTRPGVDVTDVVPGAGGVALVRWEGLRPERVAFGELQNRRQDWLDGRLPGMAHRQVSASADGRFAVIRSWSDQSPGRYYLHDRESQTLHQVGVALPWLEGRLPPREAIEFAARDGSTLQGYLTLPPGSAGNRPLLVMPHGGPWARDHWGFDPAAQYFASRGWAVLQVNFRGSTGFGRAHLAAGRRQWDGVMLDDLADGARWAARRGLADSGRVCILGASFGGYAALMSAVRYPDLYRCAVSYAAVTDLAGRIEAFRAEGNGRAYHEWRDMVGDPGRVRARLVDASPLNHARALRVPVMIAHGMRDRRVPPDQGLRLAAALGRAGRPHEVLWLPGAGHGMETAEDRAHFHRRALSFINAMVGSPVE